MSKAAELAALIGSQTALSNRNLIINGAMQVAQRGTSATGVTSSDYYAADRWKIDYASAGTWTVSQSTTAPTGFANSFKMDCTTADASLSAGDALIFNQRIEGQNLQHLKKGTSDAESVTLSFWVRSSKTGTYIAELLDNDNTRAYSQSYTISSADTWEHKSLVYSGDTTGALGNDNDLSLYVNFWLAAGTDFTSGTLATAWASKTDANRAVGQVNLADSTSNEWYITGVQLEVGEQATPFEHRSYGDELRRCQRYYVDIKFGLNEGPVYSPCRDAGYNHIRAAHVQYPVPMRATPTVSIQSGSANSMDRVGRGQELCYPKADNVYNTHFQNIVKFTSAAQTTTANWVDNGNYINRAGYKADAEL